MEGLGSTIREDLVVETEELSQPCSPGFFCSATKHTNIQGNIEQEVWYWESDVNRNMDLYEATLHTRCSRETTAS